MDMHQAEQLFINEAEELLAQMESCLLEVDGGEAAIEERIDEIFRAAHTIKGSAGLFGFDAVVAFTHSVESVLDKVRGGELSYSAGLAELMFDCHRHMSVLIEQLKGGDAADQLQEQRLISALNTYLSNEIPHAPLNAPADLPAASQPMHTWLIDVRYGQDTFRDGMDPASHLNYLNTLGEISDVRLTTDFPADTFDPESCYVSLHLQLVSSAGADDILEVFEFVRESSEINIIAADAASPALSETQEQELPVTGSAAVAAIESPECISAGTDSRTDTSQGKKAERGGSDVSFLKVEAGKLDRLIALIGEMVTSGATIEMMMREMTDSRITEAFSGMVGLVEQVRDGALQLRMVQVGETFSRLRRIVRDVAKETGKCIDLKISGSETELDKSMVDKLGDPLMHIVRNAIDHGIEAAEQRLAAGKPEQGTLHLNAYHDSGSVVIEVSDDGAGLNAEKIYRKAVERGLIESGRRMSEDEIYRLIFAPGFSTADAVTKLSGRGVGMDVVKRNIDDLKGLIELSSKKGHGTMLRIRLPLTLAIIDSFQVSVRDTHLVIPTSMIKECIGFDRNRLNVDRNFINLRGEVLPFVRVAEIFGFDVSAPQDTDPVVSAYIDNMLDSAATEEHKEHLVVVQFADKRAGLVVDELLGEVQAVVKPISALFRSIRGISGTTILGSGDVGFIVDVPQFIELARNKESSNINKNLLEMTRI